MSSTLYGLRRHLGVVREGGAGAGCGVRVRVRVRDTCGANFARTAGSVIIIVFMIIIILIYLLYFLLLNLYI